MKIEKNIPMPDRSQTGKYKEVLLKMEVTDSVVTDFNGQAGFRQAAKVLGYKVRARKIGKRTGCVSMGSEYSAQYRVWRIK